MIQKLPLQRGGGQSNSLKMPLLNEVEVIKYGVKKHQPSTPIKAIKEIKYYPNLSRKVKVRVAGAQVLALIRKGLTPQTPIKSRHQNLRREM